MHEDKVQNCGTARLGVPYRHVIVRAYSSPMKFTEVRHVSGFTDCLRQTAVLRSVLVLALIAVPFTVRAQIEATVSGVVVDVDSAMPVPHATVTVSLESDATPLTGVIADESGRFVIE